MRARREMTAEERKAAIKALLASERGSSTFPNALVDDDDYGDQPAQAETNEQRRYALRERRQR